MQRCAILLLLAISGSRAYDRLKSIYTWKTLDFVFPSEQARQIAIRNGDFIPGAPLPIDVDVYEDGECFRRSRCLQGRRECGQCTITVQRIAMQRWGR